MRTELGTRSGRPHGISTSAIGGSTPLSAFPASVHIHRDETAYEVEFLILTGQTVAVATVLASNLRSVSRRDVTHVRELAVT